MIGKLLRRAQRVKFLWELEVNKARARRDLSGPLGGLAKSVGVSPAGYNVLCNDNVVVAMYGFTAPTAVAYVELETICVSSEFLTLPSDVQQAILSHEDKHILARHSGEQTIEREFECDDHSRSNGYDICAALEMLRNSFLGVGYQLSDVHEIQTRIDRLK